MRRPIAPPPSGEVDEFDALARDIGLPGYVTGPRAAIAATAPPRAPFARPLEMRGPQMRRIEQGDFARSRGMGQDDARGDLLYGRTLAGFTRAAYNNTREGGLSYLVPDPSNIRSIFAAFDPAKSGSSDLLAGVPLALGGAALAAQEAQKPRVRPPLRRQN